MKNSLNETGLSLTQAQSISNLINQRASEIGKKLNKINNSSKTLLQSILQQKSQITYQSKKNQLQSQS